MSEEAHNHENNGRNYDNWQEHKTNQEDHRTCSNERIEYETEVEVNDFITCFLFELRKVIFSDNQIEYNEDNSENTSWKNISNEMKNAQHFHTFFFGCFHSIIRRWSFRFWCWFLFYWNSFFAGTDFLTTFFGAGGVTTGAVFFGVTFSTLAFDTTFFAGTVFFATGDFSCVDAFFVGLFFVWVFIREILGKDFRKSKIYSLFDIFPYNANIYSPFILFPCLIKISPHQKNA